MARGLFNADGRLIGYQPGDVVTMLFGIDPAHGPDHSAVTVFEKHPDGSLRMVASEMRAELRPPIKCTGNGQYSVEGITPGLVALDYLEKALASPFGTLPAIHRAVEAATQDPHPTHPTDEVHEAVERVIGHIADGKVTKTGRAALRGALDKADASPTGRAASDAAIGRIARLT